MTLDDKKRQLEKITMEMVAVGGGTLAGPGVNVVPGEGNPDAKILFIGEAPGFNENEQKRPFVGQAGKLLRKTLIENGWKEEEVYITNIVKVRPPENRDPLPEEIEFFRPLLDKQIETIDPSIIVTLGRFSMYKFLGDGVSISRIHGQPRTINWQGKSITIFPMFHPAAALRAGEMMTLFLEDFKKLRRIVDGQSLENQTLEINTLPKEPMAKVNDNSKQLELI